MTVSRRRFSAWDCPIKRVAREGVTPNDIADALGVPNDLLGRALHQWHRDEDIPCQCVERLAERIADRQLAIVAGGRALYVSPY